MNESTKKKALQVLRSDARRAWAVLGLSFAILLAGRNALAAQARRSIALVTPPMT